MDLNVMAISLAILSLCINVFLVHVVMFTDRLRGPRGFQGPTGPQGITGRAGLNGKDCNCNCKDNSI